MKDLSPAILDAVDLDAPPDLLSFTILVPPAHGKLLHGTYGLDMSKDMGPEILQRSISVQSFTIQALHQGQFLFYKTSWFGTLFSIGGGAGGLSVQRLTTRLAAPVSPRVRWFVLSGVQTC